MALPVGLLHVVVRNADGKPLAFNRNYDPGYDPATSHIEHVSGMDELPAGVFWDGAAFVPASAPLLATWVAEDTDTRAAMIDQDNLAQAIARVAWEEIQKATPAQGRTLRTWEEFRTRVRAVYRSTL